MSVFILLFFIYFDDEVYADMAERCVGLHEGGLHNKTSPQGLNTPVMVVFAVVEIVYKMC